MKPPPIRKKRQEELLLSVLNAWKTQVSKPSVCHITHAGFERYLVHPNPKVRAAARRHPRRFKK